MATPRIDRIEASSALAGALAVANGLTTLVDPTIAQISVPSTTVVGRASIPDISQDCAVSFGINRIPVQSIYQLQNEFGPNGEPVFGVAGDTLGLMRFVGAGWTSTVNTYGNQVFTINTTDYCEVTFYGTALNLLTVNAASMDVRATVDGGTEGGNLLSTSPSTVIGARNYAPNQILSVVSGLSLGVHTVKLRNNNAAGYTLNGFEILNTNSTTSLSINKGKVFGNQSVNTLLANALSAYNSGFETGSLGTKGGHALIYLKSDGTVGKAITAANTSQLFLTSADHTNEEASRIYHFREFGAGRADDFTAITIGSTSNFAFTLDDGTTSLVAAVTAIQIINGVEGIVANGGNSVTITFVGAGLDIFQSHGTTSRLLNVFVDGNSVGIIQASAIMKKSAVVSGLPYGSHTVRLLSDATVGGPAIFKFIVYQPKKPSIPTGAIELADYNVMADCLQNASSVRDTVASGVLRKSGLREHTYVGTWAPSIDPNNFSSGWNLQTSTSGAYFEYTFFGTGFDLRGLVNTGAASNVTLLVDGVNLSSYPTSFVSTSITGLSFSSAGVLTGTASIIGQISMRCSGIPLGKHTLRVTNNNTSFWYSDVLDIITPIHSPKNNSLYDAQNTLPVGSNSLSDSRKYSVNASQRKNVSQAFGLTSGPSTSSTSLIPCPDMSVVHSNASGRIRIAYGVTIIPNAANTNTLQAFVDGVGVGVPKFVSTISGGSTIASDSLVLNVAPGVHKVDVYWTTNSGTITAQAFARSLLVEELS